MGICLIVSVLLSFIYWIFPVIHINRLVIDMATFSENMGIAV